MTLAASPSRDRRLGDWGCFALILAAALIAYFPAMAGTFVTDDRSYVTPPSLRSLAGLGRIWIEVGATPQYSPVLHTAFWIEHRLWGDAPVGYHLTNVILHAAAACLLVLVLRRLRAPGARLAGFLFALHPLCVESVAWISEQKNTLSTVFYLLAALAYLRFEEKRRFSGGGLGSGLYLLATFFFALALLAKTVTATLPVALLAALWWRRGRLEWRRDVLPFVPWVALGAAAGCFAAWFEKDLMGASGSGFGMGWAARCLVAGRAVWFYFGKLVWPARLVFIYPRWTVDPRIGWQWLFPLALAPAIAALWLLRRRSRAPLAVALAFLAALFPTLGFFDIYFFAYSFVADHLAYLACLAAFAFAAGLWARWDAGGGRLARPAAIAGLGLLGLLTWRQSGLYRDGATLYAATLARNPACWMAHYSLGETWAHTPGRLNDAVPQFEEALRLKPDDAEVHNDLAAALLRIPGRLPDAVEHLRRALAINPNYAGAHNNLGNALVRTPGRAAEAAIQYERALQIDPDLDETRKNLANVLMHLPGRLPEAADQYERILERHPGDADAQNNLANALMEIPGHTNEAIAHYEQALRIDPNLAQAHNNLANALVDLPGRLPEAIDHYEQALRIDPRLAAAHHNVAVAYARIGRLRDAERHFQQALAIDPTDRTAREALLQIQAELLLR